MDIIIPMNMPIGKYMLIVLLGYLFLFWAHSCVRVSRPNIGSMICILIVLLTISSFVEGKRGKIALRLDTAAVAIITLAIMAATIIAVAIMAVAIMVVAIMVVLAAAGVDALQLPVAAEVAVVGVVVAAVAAAVAVAEVDSTHPCLLSYRMLYV